MDRTEPTVRESAPRQHKAADAIVIAGLASLLAYFLLSEGIHAFPETILEGVAELTRRLG